MSRNFNGTTDVIACGTINDVMTENGALTVSLWMFPNSLGEGSQGFIFSKDTAGSSVGVGIRCNLTNILRFFVFGTTTLARNSGNNVIVFGVWQNIAITWDGSTTASNVLMYWNGSQTTYGITTNGVGLADNAASVMRIGNNNIASQTFDGKISHVQVFDRVLNLNEIKQIMWFPGSVKSGLRRYYPLWGTSSNEPDIAGVAGPLSQGVLTGTTRSSDPPIGRNFRLLRRNIVTRYNTVTGAVVYTKNLSDSIILNESITKDTLKYISQNITLSETQSKDILKILIQAITFSESKILDFLKLLNQSSTLSESIVNDTTKLLSDSIILSESKVLDFLKILSQSITLNESNIKNILKILSESLNLTESQIKEFIKLLTDSMTLTELQNISLVVIARALITFLARGIVDTHDEIQMTHDLSFTGLQKENADSMKNQLVTTGILKKDMDEAEIDSDRITWDFHNS